MNVITTLNKFIGTIFAIGGGDIRRGETKIIDKEIITQVQKKKPKLLFIPIASSDSLKYVDIVTKYFSKLGCEVNVLYLIEGNLSKKRIESQILLADIIYFGGGNVLKMMIAWRRLGVDKILQKAYRKNIILTGLSASSICWFDYGNSDSRKFTSNSN